MSTLGLVATKRRIHGEGRVSLLRHLSSSHSHEPHRIRHILFAQRQNRPKHLTWPKHIPRASLVSKSLSNAARSVDGEQSGFCSVRNSDSRTSGLPFRRNRDRWIRPGFHRSSDSRDSQPKGPRTPKHRCSAVRTLDDETQFRSLSLAS